MARARPATVLPHVARPGLIGTCPTILTRPTQLEGRVHDGILLVGTMHAMRRVGILFPQAPMFVSMLGK